MAKPVPALHENLLWVAEEKADHAEVCDDIGSGYIDLLQVGTVVSHLWQEDVVGHVPL